MEVSLLERRLHSHRDGVRQSFHGSVPFLALFDPQTEAFYCASLGYFCGAGRAECVILQLLGGFRI